MITRSGSLPPAIFTLTHRDWIKTKVLLLGSELMFGAPFATNSGRQNPKRAFKKPINDMSFSLLEAEGDYDESPFCFKNKRTIDTQFNSYGIDTA